MVNDSECVMKIGQKVVCINDSGNNQLKKGKIYQIYGFGCCIKCGALKFDLHIPRMATHTLCFCGYQRHYEPGDWYLADARRFAPLEEISETTYEDIRKPINVELELINPDNPYQTN